MSSLRITEDFHCGPNLDIAKFIANNSVKNEIIWKMFKRVVEGGKISQLLRPLLLDPYDPAC